MKAPPAVLACNYVVAFAAVDESVHFEQHNTLNVNGEWLDRVPCIALCQNFETSEILIEHCNEAWETLGVAAGYSSIAEAKERVERSYHGISAKWVNSRFTREQALAIHESQLKEHSCSFCGRTPLQFTSVVGDAVRICNHCVDSFHAAMNEKQS